MDLAEKLEILADSAKYDVACTSSGVDRPGRQLPDLPVSQPRDL